MTDEIISGKNDLTFGMKFIDPQAIISALEIKEDMLVGDFGTGTGYFTFPLAEKVGQNGVVFAIDILKEKLETIESRAKMLHLGNIITKRANLEAVGGSKLEENSLDWVFLVTMLFQNKDKKLVMDEAARVLKKGGKILVIEWNIGDSSFGPMPELRVSKEAIFELAQNSGLSILREIEISDFHCGVVLCK
ncbi:MAG: class I SAM-dependent methyltransferase [Candidatus Moranbacteria bacterium]|nr:class I SAM-dependent methyltransferase [Candidatus Moranbacteria bacterium]